MTSDLWAGGGAGATRRDGAQAASVERGMRPFLWIAFGEFSLQTRSAVCQTA